MVEEQHNNVYKNYLRTFNFQDVSPRVVRRLLNRVSQSCNT